MNKKSLSLSLFLLILFIFISCSPDVPKTIDIKDENLLQAIYETLQLSETEELTEAHLKKLTELDASLRNVSSLEGIEVASELKTLYLQGNKIEQLQPLLALNKLEKINLRGNTFSQEENSEAFSVIIQLEDNGVAVDYIHDPPLGIFYKINNGNTTVYLYGSIHIGSQAFYPLHEKVEDAFHQADYLGVEIDLTKEMELEMLEMMLGIGLYSDGRTLQEALNDDESFDKLVQLLAPEGFNEQILNQFKPFIVEELLTKLVAEEMGYTYDDGVDNYFLNRAEGVKPTISLENIEDQLSIYDIMSEETQVESLLMTLDKYDTLKVELENLIKYWKLGDVKELTHLRLNIEIDREDYKKYVKALTEDRDNAIAEKIINYLHSNNGETYFIVIGSIHLVGENSIIDILHEQGFQIENGYNDTTYPEGIGKEEAVLRIHDDSNVMYSHIAQNHGSIFHIAI